MNEGMNLTYLEVSHGLLEIEQGRQGGCSEEEGGVGEAVGLVVGEGRGDV